MELNLQLVHYNNMKHLTPRLNISRFSSALAIAAFALGACASTSDKPDMTDTNAVTDSRVIGTEGVTVDSTVSQSGLSGTASNLILKVAGYKEQTGQIMVAVFNNEAAFDTEGAPFRSAKIAVESAETSVTFGDLPTGDYAFKVFHDANGNGELDTNAFGMPKEKYAFSLDASDPFSAPEWVESKFFLAPGEDVRNVSLD